MVGAPALTALLTLPFPPRAPVPVVMPPARTPAFQPMPPLPGVMVAVDRSVAAENCPRNRPPSTSPCGAGTCGDAIGEDAGVSPHATVAGGDHSGRAISSGGVPPPRAPVPVVMPPVRMPALQPMPPLLGVMVAVGRSVAKENSPCYRPPRPPRGSVPVVMPPMRTPTFQPMPLSPEVAIDRSVAIENSQCNPPVRRYLRWFRR